MEGIKPENVFTGENEKNVASFAEDVVRAENTIAKFPPDEAVKDADKQIYEKSKQNAKDSSIKTVSKALDAPAAQTTTLTNTIAEAAAKTDDASTGAVLTNSPPTTGVTNGLVTVNTGNAAVTTEASSIPGGDTALGRIQTGINAAATEIRNSGGQITPQAIGFLRRAWGEAGNLAQGVANSELLRSVGSKITSTYSSLNFTKYKIALGVTFILFLGGIGLGIYDAIMIDKLVKTGLVINQQNSNGCFLLTSNSDPIRLVGCSDWYSTDDNKFSCRCGALTDSPIKPNCTSMPSEECKAPYCLGESCSARVDGSPQKCVRKDNSSLPLYQCTSKNRDDPNFIGYAYSDALPLEPFIPYFFINKQIYDDNKANKTILYILLSIGIIAFAVLMFFVVKYYIKLKK